MFDDSKLKQNRYTQQIRNNMTAVDQARISIINLIMQIDDVQKLSQIEKGAMIISTLSSESLVAGEEDMLWCQLTTKQFIDGYSEEDEVYDNL